MFSEPASEPEKPVPGKIDDDAPRILSDVWEGDLLRVVEWHGDWCRIKTRDGKSGWIYSTLARDL